MIMAAREGVGLNRLLFTMTQQTWRGWMPAAAAAAAAAAAQQQQHKHDAFRQELEM
jgi:hypothetical protein